MQIKANPRYYGQVRYRSSLEADWACTLDHLGITNREYEPKTFRLLSRRDYTPDFWLPDIGTWIEVKGYGVDREDKARELAGMLLCRCEGRCTCQWYGGQIVLIGRSGSQHGHNLTWQDALGVNTYLSQCPECGHNSWRRIRHSLRCRKCHAPAGRFPALHSSGDLPFHHADRSIWTAAS